jgi:hypothetical protein
MVGKVWEDIAPLKLVTAIDIVAAVHTATMMIFTTGHW